MYKKSTVMLLVFAFGFVLSGCGLFSKSTNKDVRDDTTTTMGANVNGEGMPGEMLGGMIGVEMKGEKMITLWDGDEASAMEADVLLQNGATVTMDGTMQMEDGTSIKMQEGDMILMNGTMEKSANTTAGAEMVAGVETMDTMVSFRGTVLAGVETKLLDFTKADYDAAVKANKNIVLYFYANWCPTCKEEFPKMQMAFNALTDSSVVGFRVNFNDNQTDADEELLAKKFGVIYQHTKVFVKNGKRVLKAPDVWEQDRYAAEIDKQF